MSKPKKRKSKKIRGKINVGQLEQVIQLDELGQNVDSRLIAIYHFSMKRFYFIGHSRSSFLEIKKNARELGYPQLTKEEKTVIKK